MYCYTPSRYRPSHAELPCIVTPLVDAGPVTQSCQVGVPLVPASVESPIYQYKGGAVSMIDNLSPYLVSTTSVPSYQRADLSHNSGVGDNKRTYVRSMVPAVHYVNYY